jgi:Family of unknown function (DUF6364)
MRQKLTLSIEDTLVEKIKVQAVLEKRSVSDMTKELCTEYLGRQKRGKGKPKQ